MSESPLIVVTRPAPDAKASAARFSGLGCDSLVASLLEFVVLNPNRPAAQKLPDAQGLSAIVLTSANAVRALIETDSLSPYLHLPAFCVGDRTADAARHAGFKTIHISDGDLADLVDLIVKSDVSGPLFYPCATHLSGDLVSALAPHGILTLKHPVYEMAPAAKMPAALAHALENNTSTIITFYSRRTTEIFTQLATPPASKSQRQTFTALCLSENVAQPLLNNHFTRIALPDYPSEEAMLSAARDILHGLRS